MCGYFGGERWSEPCRVPDSVLPAHLLSLAAAPPTCALTSPPLQGFYKNIVGIVFLFFYLLQLHFEHGGGLESTRLFRGYCCALIGKDGACDVTKTA